MKVFLSSVLIPIFVSLFTSILVIVINNFLQSKKDKKKDVCDCCKRLQRLFAHQEVSLHEESLLAELDELEFVLKNDGKPMLKGIERRVRIIGHCFSTLTRSDIDPTLKTNYRMEGIEEIQSIRREAG